MNKEQVEGKFEQLKGKVKATWGKLTDDDLKLVAGKRDQLVGKITELHGIAKEQVEKELKAMEDACCCDMKASKVA